MWTAIFIIILIVIIFNWDKILIITAILFGSIAIIKLLNFFLHIRPLNNDEILKLSEIRKNKYRKQRQAFSNIKYEINPEYRAGLLSDGRWDKINVEYSQIPAFLTSLLQYKRHEWFVLVISDDNYAKAIWCNKGDDNSSCYLKNNLENIIKAAQKNGCNTIITFHNHPHTIERTWNLLSPSEADLYSAGVRKKLFEKYNLSLISGLCSQGGYIIYQNAVAEKNYPENCTVKAIEEANNISFYENYKLFLEIQRNSSRLFKF